MTDVELIKSRLDIVDIIGEYVPLKPAGANMKAPCPFHDEKTPSFMVHRGKQIFHCFGCGVGGDMFTFIEKRENVDFAEALKILANKAGVQLTAHSKHTDTLKNRLKTLLSNAVTFYCSQLNTDSGIPARTYLLKTRELTADVIAEFKLGFAPDGWNTIGPYLRGAGFTDAEILRSGLVIKREGKDGYYDRFRKRIMFPIFDGNGLPVGFTARLLPEDEGKEKSGGKYINTPETELYQKSHIVYGLHQAKSHIREADSVIFVEGQMDTIASHQAGVRNVVASSGTALTLDQFRLVKRFSSNIVFALDQDKAGIDALKRSALVAWQAGCATYVVSMPDGMKDPADMVKESPETWKQSVKNKVPFMEYITHKICGAHNLSTADGKRNATDELSVLLSGIKDPVERGHYITLVSDLVGIDEKDMREKLQKLPPTSPQRQNLVQSDKASQNDSANTRPVIRPLDLLIALAIRNDSLAKTLIEKVSPDTAKESRYCSFYKFMHNWYSSGTKQHISHAISVSDDDTLSRDYHILELLGEKEYKELTDTEAQNEFKRLVTLHKRECITRELTRIEQQLRIHESSAKRDESVLAKLSYRFGELTKQLKNLT